MSNDPIFKDGQFAQAGVSFALPGLSNLLDRIGDLDSEKLEALAAANELPWHPGVPKQEVVFAVGAVLQTHWYIQKDGHVPGKVLQRKADQTARYEDLVRKFNSGEIAMKAKKSSKKAASVAAGPRKQLLYSFDAEKAKALRSDEYKGKESLVATLLNVLVAGRKEQYNFAEMADLYKAETGKPVSRAQFPLNKLKALKVLKATKEREAPAPAKASKAKRSKKAKLEVVDQPSAA